MYLINTEITINWEIPATTFVYTLDSWDIIVKKPDGSQEYFDAAILIADYLAPTTTTNGYVSYRVTPDTLGLWQIALTSGLGSLHYYYYEYKLQIAVNDLFTQKNVRSVSFENLP